MDHENRFLDALTNDDLRSVDEMVTSKMIDQNQIIDHRSVLCHAVEDERPDIVSSLIHHGADPSYDDYEALRIAVGIHQVSIVQIILNAIKKTGCDGVIIRAVFKNANSNTRSVFMHAMVGGNEDDDIILLFLDLIKDQHHPLFSMEWFVDSYGYGPFHFVHGLELDTLKSLIEKLPFARELVNLQTYHGDTPLHLLTDMSGVDEDSDMDDHRDHVKLLVTQGSADPDLVGIVGNTPLHNSLAGERAAITEALLRVGCGMNIFNNQGESPLKIALQSKRKKAIELFLAFGADLQKEPYLYDEVEMPNQFKGETFAKHRDSTKIRPDLLAAMKALRQFNYEDDFQPFKNIFSLQRLCREAIRSQYKPNADEVISAMNGVPAGLKSYLLLEDEDEVLASLVNWDRIRNDIP